MHGASRLLAATTFVLALSVAHGARADDLAEARADYDAGAAAYDRKDYRTAADRFARADERVPNGRALQLAMAAALLASDAPLAMNLVERAESRAGEREIADLSRKLRARFGRAAGRIRFVCMQTCTAEVDGAAVDANRSRWVAPGTHSVVLRTEGSQVQREVAVGAREIVSVTIDDAMPGESASTRTSEPEPVESAEEAPRSPGVEPQRDRGLPPFVFWSTVVLGGVAAGTATALTIDVANRHADFVEAPSAQGSREGEAAQTRARVMWGVTGVLAVAAVVVGLNTDFAGSSGTALRLDVGPGGVHVAGRFR